MNKTALRSFATNARRELLDKVKAKAMKIGITEENVKKADIESSDAVFIEGRQLSSEEKKQRKNLIKRIEQKDFNQVMEEVAYTWFNRFTALRFMEVNEYLPSNIRVLSSSSPGDPIPEIIKEAMSLDFDIDKEWVYERKVKNENDKLFQYLIIKQCNDLYDYMPFMFEKIDDYTEILFPEGLLSKDSFLRNMTNTESIPERDWENVQIIGWLYQFYIAEEKNRVIHAKKKYKTDEIPFATQLFTPDWIVRYMVQNSLGRYWVENHPKDRDLIDKWDYYLDSPNTEPEFEEKIIPYLKRDLKVEEIKCFDPAMGSGHILVYLFDVLYELYSKCGYLERDIPRLIIENNLFGLDIDDRAYQLACFSVVMKAMQRNIRFLRSIKRHGLVLNLYSIQETNTLDEEDFTFIAGENDGENYEKVKKFLKQFYNAKMLGSIIKVDESDKSLIEDQIKNIQDKPAENIFEAEIREKVLGILPSVLKQATIMSQMFDIVVTNPPYFGGKYMEHSLSEYVSLYYPDSKSDMFAVFVDFCRSKVIAEGHIGMLTPLVWMFISSYEKLRKKIIDNNSITTLIQLEYNAFPEATVPVCTFTLRGSNTNDLGQFISLSKFTGPENQPTKTLEAIENPEVPYRYKCFPDQFKKISGNPIVYWASTGVFSAFENKDKVSDYGKLFEGVKTRDNKRFLRLWFEIDNKNKFNKWKPYSKGGGFKKWYGNNLYVINWENEGEEIRKFRKSSGANFKHFFEESLTWSAISSYKFSVRYINNSLFGGGGSAVTDIKEDYLYILLGFLNSKVSNELMNMLSSTLNYEVGNVSDLPVIINDGNVEEINQLVREAIQISKDDWDSYETSTEFETHPLIKHRDDTNLIENIFNKWEFVSDSRFNRLKIIEERLNEIFIQSYNVDDYFISPNVEDRDITINKVEKEDTIKSFISYAVGCMLGRFSLDIPGVICTNQSFDKEKYNSFKADEDNILPILSGSYFNDDIASRLEKFIEITFGKETLKLNLNYVANVLGKKKNETAIETIRRYFTNSFYEDHIGIYSARGRKAPIYWMFTSGKQKAFNCLIYLHRYDSTTLGRIRTDYLHELQLRMDAEKESLLNIIDGDSTSREIAQAKKELKSLEKKIGELKDYDEVLHHLADQQIEIDLDDGVEINYKKFINLLAKK